jgi:hypothetical protein
MTTSTGVAAAAGRPIRSSLIAAIAGISLLLPTAHAAAPGKTPDIFGVWLAIANNSANHDPKWANKPYAPTPEFTAWGAEQSREQGRLGVELPTPGACEPISPVSFVGGFFPTQILQGHNQIVMLNEWVAVPRRIYMDGRGHPPAEDALPSWEGHSIGHWEGDTLVVETVNYNPLVVIQGAPVSDAAKVTERFTRIDADTVTYQFTVDDPKTWAKPFSGEYNMVHIDGGIYEYACHEGNYGMANNLSGARATEKK